MCDSDMHVFTPFRTPHFLFFILYLLISRILTDVVYFFDIHTYFVHTVNIYVISGPGSRYLTTLSD